MAWQGVVWCGVVWCGEKRRGEEWRGMAWRGVARCGASRCGVGRQRVAVWLRKARRTAYLGPDSILLPTRSLSRPGSICSSRRVGRTKVWQPAPPWRPPKRPPAKYERASSPHPARPVLLRLIPLAFIPLCPVSLRPALIPSHSKCPVPSRHANLFHPSRPTLIPTPFTPAPSRRRQSTAPRRSIRPCSPIVDEQRAAWTGLSTA